MNPEEASEPVDELLAAAYALDSPQANRSLYARWADTYETGFVTDSQYHYPDQVATVFATFALGRVTATDVVVDIGCGTGLGGLALVGHGPLIIDGIDISPEMLQQAASKQHDGQPVYRQLLVADLTQTVPVADGTYAAAMSAGTFTHGHVGPEALGEVIRIIRSGGHAVIGINAAHFAVAGFAAELDRLVGDGRIADLQLVDRPIYADSDMNDPDKVAHIAVFTVG